MRTLLLASLVLAGTAVLPTSGSAQSNCGYFQQCSGGLHWLQTNFDDQSKNAHFDCLLCSGEPAYPVCHPVCRETFGDAGFKLRYEAVVAAADKGDVLGILSMAPALPGYVMWNAERGAIQIKSCAQTALIASLRVRDPWIVAMAEKLPTSQVVMVPLAISPFGTP